MVMLDSARRRVPVPALARWLLGLGIAATLAANVAHGPGDGPIGAGGHAVGLYELLTMVIRTAQQYRLTRPGSGSAADPLQEQAAEFFAEQLAAHRVHSIRTIRAHSTSVS